MAHLGRILQFDGARGYGFIAPDEGGADVFFHVNEFHEDDEGLITPGTRVTFEIMDGERGKKAYGVSIAGPAPSASVTPAHAKAASPETVASRVRPDDEAGVCDALTVEEMRTELAEMFLGSASDLTVAQIVRVRDDFMLLARKHGWVQE